GRLAPAVLRARRDRQFRRELASTFPAHGAGPIAGCASPPRSDAIPHALARGASSSKPSPGRSLCPGPPAALSSLRPPLGRSALGTRHLAHVPHPLRQPGYSFSDTCG